MTFVTEDEYDTQVRIQGGKGAMPGGGGRRGEAKGPAASEGGGVFLMCLRYAQNRS